LLGALFRAEAEILFHQSEINVAFENFQHRIERLCRRAGGFWGFVKLVRLHGRSLKPLPRARNHFNKLVLSWTNAGFNLQSAPAVTDSFTNLTAATSPYTHALTGPQQFFRLTSP